MGDLGRCTLFDRVLVSNASLHRPLSSTNIIERCDEIACIGSTLSAFSRKHAADVGRMRIEADRRANLQLECDADDMSAEPAGHRHRLLDAVGRCRSGIAQQRKENVSNRHQWLLLVGSDLWTLPSLVPINEQQNIDAVGRMGLRL